MQRMQCLRNLCAATLALSTLAPAVSFGAGVLDEVPNDAIGFVVVHDLAALDAKVGRLAAQLHRSLPRPLSFLRQVTGIGEGLNIHGDFLLVLFPGAEDSGNSRLYGVWLPIADYDRFAKSMHARSVDGVAAVTIAGEDLLVARHGDFAIVMDPNQRDHLAELATATPAPPLMPNWKDWMSSNDVTVVALAPGLQQISNLLDENGSIDPAQQSNDDIFGSASPDDEGDAAVNTNRTPTNTFQATRREIRKWAEAAPELAQFAQQVTVAACGLKLDDQGNALAGLRIAVNKEFADELRPAKKNQPAEPPPSAYEKGGGFAAYGAARMPSSLLTTLAAAYARRTAADLKSEEKTELDETALKQLEDAVEKASADVQSIAVLSQPGQNPQPVYTNNYIVLRVTSASSFVDHAKEVMRLWNKSNRDAKGQTRLIFDVDESKIGEHSATQFSLDVAALDGGPVVPEVRQAMEKLFGPGGKLRAWIVPTDDHTVLLAAATPEQVAATAKILDRKQPIEWKNPEVSQANALLPAESDGRLFLDLHRYTDWMQRESAALIGVPVIGGPLVREFPASPPLAVAGGTRNGEIWLDAVGLAPTIRSADLYFTRSRARNSIRVRGRIVVPARRLPRDQTEVGFASDASSPAKSSSGIARSSSGNGTVIIFASFPGVRLPISRLRPALRRQTKSPSTKSRARQR